MPPSPGCPRHYYPSDCDCSQDVSSARARSASGVLLIAAALCAPATASLVGWGYTCVGVPGLLSVSASSLLLSLFPCVCPMRGQRRVLAQSVKATHTPPERPAQPWRLGAILHITHRFPSIKALRGRCSWRTRRIGRELAQTTWSRRSTIRTRTSSREANVTGRRTSPRNSGTSCPRSGLRGAHCESLTGGIALGLPQGPHHLQCVPPI